MSQKKSFLSLISFFPFSFFLSVYVREMGRQSTQHVVVMIQTHPKEISSPRYFPNNKKQYILYFSCWETFRMTGKSQREGFKKRIHAVFLFFPTKVKYGNRQHVNISPQNKTVTPRRFPINSRRKKTEKRGKQERKDGTR